jgi:hypothetical protein
MTTAPDPLDLRARQLHASALAHTSPATLARLRQARQAAREAGHSRRPWFAAGGILAAALAASLAAAGDAAAPLQEDPGFYLWLASADVPALALE